MISAKLDMKKTYIPQYLLLISRVCIKADILYFFQIYLRKNAPKVPVAYTNQINTIRGYKNVNILLLISKAYDLKIVQSYFKMTQA